MKITENLKSSDNKINNFLGILESISESTKNKIKKIISLNYGEKNEGKILDLFKNIGTILSDRNSYILKEIREKCGIDFLKLLDFSGGIVLDENIIKNNNDSNINNFFRKNYTILKDGKYKRGYGYYFNFTGLSQNKNQKYNFNPSEYFKNILEYYNDTRSALSYFQGKIINNLEKNERLIFINLLEHYKNILYFFQNLTLLLSNEETLKKQILKISDLNFRKYIQGSFKNLINKIDFNEIKDEILNNIFYFNDALLEVGNNQEFKLSSGSIDVESIENIASFFTSIHERENEIIEEHGENFNLRGEQKFIGKINDRLRNNLIRVSREQDNPVKQILSCYNIGKNIRNNKGNINLYGILYGGVEMPYMMNYTLNRFFNIQQDKIDINIISLSGYHTRNLKQVSTKDDYLQLMEDKCEGGKCINVVLDDNVWYGSTLQVGSNSIGEEIPTINGVGEVGFRRKELGKLKEGNNINFILSQATKAATVTPIKKTSEHYLNLIGIKIRKRLPGIYGKF